MLLNGEKSCIDFEIPSEWIYRGEGNCNVVLSLPKSGKILRIRKTNKPNSLIGWLIVWISDIIYWYLGKAIEDEVRDLKFYSAIMRPLIGRKYTSEAVQVILSRKQIKILENELRKYRPEFRKHKILQYGRASVFEDFAFIPQEECGYLPFKISEDTFAIEIKPKQGWRSLSEKHFPACVFCMNQFMKLENKQIDTISGYCPEDLFSGDHSRMKSAIKGLMNVPQNNFRVFKNGLLVYGEQIKPDILNLIQSLFSNTDDNQESLKDEFAELIVKCLSTNFINVNFPDNCEEKLFCEWNEIIQQSNMNSALPKGCVLEKILSIQMLDTEGCSYYDKLLNRENASDWNYIDILLDKIDNEDICLKCTIMMLGNTNHTEEEMDLAFIPYMISAIAKDCSLMIALKKIHHEDVCDDLEMKNIIKTKYGHFLVNIGVFDLYPKRLSSIRKHSQRNKNILQAYLKAKKSK